MPCFGQQSFDYIIPVDDTSKVLSVLDVSVSKKSNLAPSTTIIDEQELQQHSGLAIADVLERASGAATLRTGNTISKPVINGMYGNRLHIYSQGVRVEGQQWGDEHAPEIDGHISSTISVYQGANALTFAQDALGGVVLMQSAPLHQIDKRLGGKWQSAGFLNGRGGSSSLLLEGKSKHVQGVYWRGQGSLKGLGDYRTPDYYVPNSGVREHNFSLETGFFRERYAVSLFYSQYHSRISVTPWSHIGNLTDLNEVLSGAIVRSEGAFSYHMQRPNQQIAHELLKIQSRYYFKKERTVQLTLSRQYNLRQEYDLHTPWTPPADGSVPPQVQFELLTYSGEALWVQLRERSTTKIGTQATHMGNVTNGRFFIPNYIRQQAGGFVNHKVQLNKWEVNGTMRYDINQLTAYFRENDAVVHKKNNYANLSGAVEVIHQQTDHLRWFVGLNRMWRAPGINELHSKGLHHGTASYEEGSDGLNQEIMNQVSLGMMYQTKKWGATVVPFVSYIADYIYLQPSFIPVLSIQGAFPAFYYAQTNAWYNGLRYSVNYEKNKLGISLRHRGQFLHVKDAQSNEFIIGIPPTSFTTELFYHPALKQLKERNLFGSVNWTYTAQQWRIAPERDYMAPPDAFHLFSASVGASLPVAKSSLQITLGVENIFNTTYRNYMNRLRYYLHEPGRQVSIRLNYKF
jgi:iron complex outermembrane receptor protein